jgi:hypothetical protein
MARSDSQNITRRRDFLTLTAAAATAAMAPLGLKEAGANQRMQPVLASPPDDSALLALEEQIFEQHDGAAQYDDEIFRLYEIWTAEAQRLYDEALAQEIRNESYLTPKQRWQVVTDEIPECREHDRLCSLQEPFYSRREALIQQMFATPAHTAQGRRAKLLVLLSCIMGDHWQCRDEETDYGPLMARTF